jgi:hypothetical protein
MDFQEQSEQGSAPNDPLYRRALEMVVAEMVQEANENLAARPRPVSGQRRPYRVDIPQFRRIAARVCIVLVAAAAISLSTRWWAYAYLLAAPGIVSAILCGGFLLGETLYGSGWHNEVEYVGPDGFSREYSFEPSIRSPARLFAIVGIAVAGLVLGYAEIYLGLSWSHFLEFSKPLQPISAVYFSLVTFATVGYGDLYPNDSLARLLVSTEIVFAMFVVGVVLAASMSWLLGRQQDLSSTRATKWAQNAQRRERLLKEAGLGLYGDTSGRIRAKMEELRRSAGEDEA